MPSSRPADDRTVHAHHDELEVVRYDRAGKWWLERAAEAGTVRQTVTLTQAARTAVELERAGGTVSAGLPGGAAFDRKVTAARNGHH